MQVGIKVFGLATCLKETTLFATAKRCAGTFTSVTGKALWDSTSPESKRTGRGKRARIRRRDDFSNRHKMGEGISGMLWPGLNVQVNQNVQQRTKEEQDEYLAKQEELNNIKKSFKISTERGWTGGHYGGMRLGPPDPVHGQNFFDFESVIMNLARVSHMNGAAGRVYSYRAIVAVGNFKGLVGVGMCVSPTIAGAFRKSRQKAVNRLMFVERFEDRTLFEDIYVNHHRTWLSLRQQPEGYGLRCHRALKDMCKLIGFKDVYIKVYGSTTMLNLLKCFLKGMRMQESHQQKADRLGYHVVEFDELCHNFPRVLASPSGEVKTEPHDDYQEYLNQELIVRDLKMSEGAKLHTIHRAIASNNKGPPVPASQRVPRFLTNVRNLKLESK